VPTPVNIVPKLAALQYDGTNSAQILEVNSPEAQAAIVSEADGVLVVSPGPPPYGTITIKTGQYLIYQASGGQLISDQAVDTLDGYALLP
jgi:hypothetical protein